VALIVGNWKMHGLRAALSEVEAMAAGAAARGTGLWLAPSFTLVAAAAQVAAGAGGGHLRIGGQDCHEAAEGAFTGSVSAAQLADAGARFVIVGHSERRAGLGESDALVRAKAGAALAAGLEVIVCVGETEAQRDAGRAGAVVAAQLAGSLPDGADGLVLAYEPVWAIGTGRTPTLDEVAAMHGLIGEALAARYGRSVPVLYGGSVKPDNAGALLGLPGVAGALVGGASLRAASLLAIVDAAG
jgi:triosephosphate isomerase